MVDPRNDRTHAVDARFDTGALRAELPVSAWGGPGEGLRCDFRDGQTLRFHFRCFARWLARVQTRRPAAS